MREAPATSLTSDGEREEGEEEGAGMVRVERTKEVEGSFEIREVMMVVTTVSAEEGTGASEDEGEAGGAVVEMVVGEEGEAEEEKVEVGVSSQTVWTDPAAVETTATTVGTVLVTVTVEPCSTGGRNRFDQP